MISKFLLYTYSKCLKNGYIYNFVFLDSIRNVIFFMDNSSIFYIRQKNLKPIPDPTKKEKISDIKKQLKKISTEVQINSEKLR